MWKYVYLKIILRNLHSLSTNQFSQPEKSCGSSDVDLQLKLSFVSPVCVSSCGKN